MLVPVNEIEYFEVLHHQVIVHMKKGEQLSTRSSLSEIISALPGGSFVQPHKSYYINVDYVDRITQQTIKMLNGDMIPISRSRKDVFQARLSEYVKGHRPDEHLD